MCVLQLFAVVCLTIFVIYYYKNPPPPRGGRWVAALLKKISGVMSTYDIICLYIVYCYHVLTSKNVYVCNIVVIEKR